MGLQIYNQGAVCEEKYGKGRGSQQERNRARYALPAKKINESGG